MGGKTKELHIRCSEEQKRKLLQEAREHGMANISQYVWWLAYQERTRKEKENVVEG